MKRVITPRLNHLTCESLTISPHFNRDIKGTSNDLILNHIIYDMIRTSDYLASK